MYESEKQKLLMEKVGFCKGKAGVSKGESGGKGWLDQIAVTEEMSGGRWSREGHCCDKKESPVYSGSERDNREARERGE